GIAGYDRILPHPDGAENVGTAAHGHAAEHAVGPNIREKNRGRGHAAHDRGIAQEGPQYLSCRGILFAVSTNSGFRVRELRSRPGMTTEIFPSCHSGASRKRRTRNPAV